MNVHRFRNRVAINPPNGPTIYLDADTAHNLAYALGQAALDVQNRTFQASTFNTTEIEGFAE